MKDIQEILGHSDITTTSKFYLRFDFLNKVRGISKISEAIPFENLYG